MNSNAVVFSQPKSVSISSIGIADTGPADVVVSAERSGISTGTERLLWSGRMPDFPGMGYPLVPGYETVGTIIEAGPESGREVGERVFVPGASCFESVRCLFGASASTLVVPGDRVVPLASHVREEGLLLALAATALHTVRASAELPELIVGHGVLGRLIARITIALGGQAPTVWETNAVRRKGAAAYSVIAPDDDDRRDYRAIVDVSGDANILDSLIGRAAKFSDVVLAGFYAERPSFDFAPAFMREVRLCIAAEWSRRDMQETSALVDAGALQLADLISHCYPIGRVHEAYETAFEDTSCLKMTLDWTN